MGTPLRRSTRHVHVKLTEVLSMSESYWGNNCSSNKNASRAGTGRLTI